MPFAAIIKETIYYEGDERSRTHPGHGYPAYTETVEKLHYFKDEAEMRNYAENEIKHGCTPRIIKFEELPIKVEVKINI